MWQVDYDEESIEESTRKFGERYKNHLKAPSPIYGSIVGSEGYGFARKIKVSILDIKTKFYKVLKNRK